MKWPRPSLKNPRKKFPEPPMPIIHVTQANQNSFKNQPGDVIAGLKQGDQVIQDAGTEISSLTTGRAIYADGTITQLTLNLSGQVLSPFNTAISLGRGQHSISVHGTGKVVGETGISVGSGGNQIFIDGSVTGTKYSAMTILGSNN